MTLIRATTFQHTGRQWKRHDASGYIDSRSRRDCCARCDNMIMRGRNPFCGYHRIFVQKMGICKNLNEPMPIPLKKRENYDMDTTIIGIDAKGRSVNKYNEPVVPCASGCGMLTTDLRTRLCTVCCKAAQPKRKQGA